ncbi:DUF2746 domain-containing protein [Arcanobacterium haemolyticum]|nr:DUF2746 domain-containing protein [Arcanobacterium haemolyticum]
MTILAVHPLADPRIGELITTTLIAVLGAIGALAAWIQRKFSSLDQKTDRLDQRTAESAHKLTAVNGQVSNDHGTNLRDDLDTMRDEIRDGFKRMDHQFGEVHQRQEREAEERQALDRRSASEHERIWKAIENH